MALAAAVLWLATFVGIAVLMPGPDDTTTSLAWGPFDRVLTAALGVAGAAFLTRYARIRAVPSTSGLTVRNLFRTEQITWPEIVAVRFGGGAPWVGLDLADTSNVSVMAIQRSDGEFARREASRLRTLVDHHSAVR